MFRKMLLVLFIVVGAFLFLPDEAAAANCDPNNIIFSEIDYSQPGTDNNEFVEIYFVNATTVSECEVHIVSGSGSFVTGFSLAGSYAGGEFLVLGPLTQVILNGTGGVALVDTQGGNSVQQFISFEGVIDNYLGATSTDIGCVDEGTTVSQSCQNGPEPGHGDWYNADPTPDSAGPTAITMSAFSAGSSSNAAQVLGLSFILLTLTGFAGWLLSRRQQA